MKKHDQLINYQPIIKDLAADGSPGNVLQTYFTNGPYHFVYKCHPFGRTSSLHLHSILKMEAVGCSDKLITMKNGVFWVVTPCGSCKNRRFGGTWRLLHQGDKNR
jgi:hypothetical protein